MSARVEISVTASDMPTLYDASDEVLGTVVRRLIEQGTGVLVMTERDGEWVAGAEFGREAEDSEMAGGAAYGLERTFEDALGVIRAEMGGVL